MSTNSLTIGQVAKFSGAKTWQVRRAADSLPIEIERIGNNRVIDRSQLPEVFAELKRRGWLPDAQEVAHA